MKFVSRKAFNRSQYAHSKLFDFYNSVEGLSPRALYHNEVQVRQAKRHNILSKRERTSIYQKFLKKELA